MASKCLLCLYIMLTLFPIDFRISYESYRPSSRKMHIRVHTYTHTICIQFQGFLDATSQLRISVLGEETKAEDINYSLKS